MRSLFRHEYNLINCFQNATGFLNEVRKKNNKTLPRTSYAFDSIWAAALMLDGAAASNKSNPGNFVLGDDTFSEPYEEILRETSFEGLSVGLISINKVCHLLLRPIFKHV